MARKRSKKVESELEEEVIEDKTIIKRRRSRATKKTPIAFKLRQKFSIKSSLILLFIIIIIFVLSLKIFSNSEEKEEIDLASYNVKIICLTPNHEVDAGNSTDFIIIAKNLGKSEDRIKLSCKGMQKDWKVKFDKNNVKTMPKKSFVSILNVTVSNSHIGEKFPLVVYATSQHNSSKQDSLIISLEIKSFGSKKVKNGDKISVDYIGCYATNGTIFDTSMEEIGINDNLTFSSDFDERRLDKDYSLLEFTVGKEEMIKGFDKAVVGMKICETKAVRIPPKDAYGELGESSHPLAGETLIFEIILKKIK